jgi:very-short-patch-repair endonuclease
MNPIIRQFLPSQVRGVYRFDNTFSQVDSVTYQQFHEIKSRFLPEKLRKKFGEHISLTKNYKATCQSINLNIPTQGRQTRANIFFQKHQYFANALQGADAINGAINFLEIQFVKKVLAPLLNTQGLNIVQPQKKIGRYFADFAIDGPTKIVLEIDGFGKFKTRYDLDNFIERQNYIASNGWKVIRFTYGQVMDTPEISMRILSDVFKGDDSYSQYLIGDNRQMNMFDNIHEINESEKTIFDLVNGFYHIQDWLVEFVLDQKDNCENEIVIYDDFNFNLPFVAISISDLYKFLDTVIKLVNIEFKLPDITIISPEVSREWRSFYHHSIRVISSSEQSVTTI